MCTFKKVLCIFLVLLSLLSFSAFAVDDVPGSAPAAISDSAPESTPEPSEPPGEEEELGNDLQEITDGVLGSFVEAFGGFGTAILDFVSNFLGGINFAGFLAASMIWIPSFYWRVFLFGLALGFVTLVIEFLK